MAVFVVVDHEFLFSIPLPLLILFSPLVPYQQHSAGRWRTGPFSPRVLPQKVLARQRLLIRWRSCCVIGGTEVPTDAPSEQSITVSMLWFESEFRAEAYACVFRQRWRTCLTDLHFKQYGGLPCICHKKRLT